MSPASLLADLGFTLGHLQKILDTQTREFDCKNDIVTALGEFNSGRVDFIHHSFSRHKRSDTATTGDLIVLIAETLHRGKRVLTLIDDVISHPAKSRVKRQ